MGDKCNPDSYIIKTQNNIVKKLNEISFGPQLDEKNILNLWQILQGARKKLLRHLRLPYTTPSQLPRSVFE